MTTDNGGGTPRLHASAEATIVPSCTERDFFELIYPYARHGAWNCVYCGEPIDYAEDGTVYIGTQRLACSVEDLGGFFQLAPQTSAPVAVNRCCSDRIATADRFIPLGRTIRCPVCGDTYTSGMVSRWQGSSQLKGYMRDGSGYAVDQHLAIPALVPVDRLGSGPV